MKEPRMSAALSLSAERLPALRQVPNIKLLPASASKPEMVSSHCRLRPQFQRLMLTVVFQIKKPPTAIAAGGLKFKLPIISSTASGGRV